MLDNSRECFLDRRLSTNAQRSNAADWRLKLRQRAQIRSRFDHVSRKCFQQFDRADDEPDAALLAPRAIRVARAINPSVRVCESRRRRHLQ
jgi:hypothetical protein